MQFETDDHKLIAIMITHRCCHRTQTDLLVQMGSSRPVETWKMLPLITDKNGHLKKTQEPRLVSYENGSCHSGLGLT